ncbi:MAG TPA: FtsX-like permease family protein [Puia sp.]|nr:FtsX-like permease family protein [Puia sp.]
MPVNPISVKVAWRNILRQRWYSLIHVLGLAIGICVCIVIYLIGRYELSFDNFHPDANRIYRVVGDVRDKDGNVIFLNSPFREVAGVEHLISGFEAQAAFHTFGSTISVPSENGQGMKEYDNRQKGSYALSTILTAPDFFHLFPHEWLAGAPSVLDLPGRIVLAESVARKYFGRTTVERMLGRKVIYDDSLTLTVSGIVRDWDQPSDLGYTSFISIGTAPDTWLRERIPTTDWSSLQPRRSQAFVRLEKGVTPARVNAELAEFLHNLKPAPVLFSGAHHLRLYLQSLRDMHYTPDFHPADTGDDFPKAYLPLLYALMWVALFVLGLAIINFINLSTAQSFQRMKEVGVRKVMGSSRRALVGQFLVETLLLTACALALSLLLMWPALWLFGDSIPAGVGFRFRDGGNWLFLLGITVFTTLAAGYYPARLMSSYLPVLSLKGSMDKSGKGGVGLRRVLIIFQFSFSLLFIIGSLVIGRQVRHMRNSDKGFNSDGVITVDYPGAEKGQMRLYAEAVQHLPGVQQAILQGHAPMGREHPMATFIYRWGNMKVMREMTVEAEIGDSAFLPFYQMQLVGGSNVYGGENIVPALVNETYARALGFSDPKRACGGQLYYRGNGLWYTICGVVKDYHQTSFHETIRPLIIITWLSDAKSVAVRLGVKGDSAKQVIAALASKWRMLFPRVPFTSTSLQETVDRLYLEENRTALLIQSATLIMILVSCMGLFGLALFSASRRAKEIGIRKVMGASVAGLSLLLSREFLLLVITAIVIASPLAWLLSNSWLRNFGYRTALDGWVLVEAGAAALVLAVVTVGFQAFRVASVNPVDVLRDQ